MTIYIKGGVKMKRTRKAVISMVGSGLMLGGGASALQGFGGAVGTNAAKGLANASSFLPAAGSIGGAGMVLGSMGGLRKIMRRKR